MRRGGPAFSLFRLMPDELVDAEHTINAPRTTPRQTTAKVDSNDPNFKNSGGDPRAREVSFAFMERREVDFLKLFFFRA